MNWDNLKNFECPYCGHVLLKTNPQYSCSHCTFTIDPWRFDTIRSTNRIRWQNLHDGCCPVCGDYLKKNTDGKFPFQKCISQDCNFRMSDNQIDKILSDPEHPANKHKPYAIQDEQ